MSGEQQSSTACARRQRPSNSVCLSALLELFKHALGTVEVAGADQDFDQVSMDSVHRGLSDAEAFRVLNRARQKRLGARSVAEGEFEEAERAQVEGTSDRLHDLQARVDRHASPLDV